MSKALFVNQNGRIVCDNETHAGSYLTAHLDMKPKAKRIVTPLDDWVRIDDEVLAMDDDLQCEACAAATRKGIR